MVGAWQRLTQNDQMPIRIQVCSLPHAAGLPLPSYATAGAAGMDLVAAVLEPVVVGPGERDGIDFEISKANFASDQQAAADNG